MAKEESATAEATQPGDLIEVEPVAAVEETPSAGEPQLNREQRRALERARLAAERCPDSGGKHHYANVISQTVPTPKGEVGLITIWQCSCGQTKINNVVVGRQSGIVLPGMPGSPTVPDLARPGRA